MIPGEIAGNMTWSQQNGMDQAASVPDNPLEVVIAEIGWPSAGDSDAATSSTNEVANFNATCAWIKSNGYLTMWFEMFDEPWKAAEGAWGPYWGIYGSTEATTQEKPYDVPVIKGTGFTDCSS